MRARRALHRLFSRFVYRDGMAIVPPQIAPEWPERQFLRRLLDRLEVDCVIDVGANRGQYAELLRLIGFKRTILSFEPSPQVYTELVKASARDNRWHAFNCALGAEVGTAQFNMMKASVFNSFRAPSTRDTALVERYNQVVETVEFEVKRLDALLPGLQSSHGFKRPFLKTDTQGYDIEVFQGASGVHSQLVGVQCELAVKRLYENVPLWTDAINEYLSAGFELAGIYSVLPRQPLLIECDCFFVQGGLAALPAAKRL